MFGVLFLTVPGVAGAQQAATLVGGSTLTAPAAAVGVPVTPLLGGGAQPRTAAVQTGMIPRTVPLPTLPAAAPLPSAGPKGGLPGAAKPTDGRSLPIWF